MVEPFPYLVRKHPDLTELLLRFKHELHNRKNPETDLSHHEMRVLLRVLNHEGFPQVCRQLLTLSYRIENLYVEVADDFEELDIRRNIHLDHYPMHRFIRSELHHLSSPRVVRYSDQMHDIYSSLAGCVALRKVGALTMGYFNTIEAKNEAVVLVKMLS